MNYIELSNSLRSNKLYIFSLRDIEHLFPQEKIKTLKNNLSRWVKKGYLYRLKRDLYEFVDVGSKAVIPDLYIANKLYSPSYVSIETALSIYNIIPGVAAQVTSVTTRPTRTFKNRHGSFWYHSCQEKAFLGYRLIWFEGEKVLIADKEKSLVDFLYFRLSRQKKVNFEEERFNKVIIRKLNWRRVLTYSRLFSKKTVKLTEALKEFAKC